jgi:SNF2 domain-containing protein
MPSRNCPSTRIEGLRGARFILTDMVGLGKTLQLAMAGMLMALYGTRPMLILAPKTLVWQWQDEMQNMLALPSDGQTMGG